MHLVPLTHPSCTFVSPTHPSRTRHALFFHSPTSCEPDWHSRHWDNSLPLDVVGCASLWSVTTCLPRIRSLHLVNNRPPAYTESKPKGYAFACWCTYDLCRFFLRLFPILLRTCFIKNRSAFPTMTLPCRHGTRTKAPDQKLVHRKLDRAIQDYEEVRRKYPENI